MPLTEIGKTLGVMSAACAPARKTREPCGPMLLHPGNNEATYKPLPAIAALRSSLRREIFCSIVGKFYNLLRRDSNHIDDNPLPCPADVLDHRLRRGRRPRGVKIFWTQVVELAARRAG